MNPFIANDPLLRLLYNVLHLSPGKILSISIVILVLLPGIISYYNKTWRDEDIKIKPISKHPMNGHGFLRMQNLYLLFLPFLNYAIFEYYENVYSKTILILQSVIKINTTYENLSEMLFSPFLNPFTSIPIFFAFLIGLVCFINFIRFHRKIQSKSGKEILRTDWLYNNGKPRIICYLFSFNTHFLQITIISSWIFHHLMIFFLFYEKLFSSEVGISLIPFHSDGMFGLSPLGDIAKSTSIVFAAFGFVTISWILGVVSTLGGWKRAFRILGIRLLLIAYMISAPIGIVIALEPAHSKIIQTKIITLKSISNKIIQNSKSISSAMNTTKFSQTKIDSCWAARNSLKNLYESVSQVPNWPLRLSNLLNILSNLFIPYLILVLFEWLKSKLKQ